MYVLLIVLFSYILLQRISNQQLVYLLLSFVIGYMYYHYEQTNIQEHVGEYKEKVDTLKKEMQKQNIMFDNKYISFLHTEPEMIQLFSELYVFAKYNPKVYKESLISLNHLLRIYYLSSLGIALTAQMIPLSKQYAKDTINSFHSILHSIPSSYGDKRFNESLLKMEDLLQKIMKKVKQQYTYTKKRHVPTIHTPPIDIYLGEEPYDKNMNANFEQY